MSWFPESILSDFFVGSSCNLHVSFSWKDWVSFGSLNAIRSLRSWQTRSTLPVSSPHSSCTCFTEFDHLSHVIQESSTRKGRQWNQEGDRIHSIDSLVTTDACSSSKPPSILFIDSLHHNQCQLVNVCMVCWTWMCIIITRQEAKSNQDKTPGTEVDMREREREIERERMQLLLPFLLIPFLQFSLPLEQSCSLCFEISVLFFPSGKNDSERKDFAGTGLQNLIPVVFLHLQSNRSLSLSCLVL